MPSMKLHPTLISLATDGGTHRRCTPEVYASSMAWLGEPMSDAQAARYEVKRAEILAREATPAGWAVAETSVEPVVVTICPTCSCPHLGAACENPGCLESGNVSPEAWDAGIAAGKAEAGERILEESNPRDYGLPQDSESGPEFYGEVSRG